MSNPLVPAAAPGEDDRDCDHLLGEVLANRYRIETRLGEGAMGTVFKATHIKVGRPFAVKVLHRRLLMDAKVAQRFEREAELAGRLRHPNVIGVVDVGETADGLRYMVMDFAEGEDLAGLLADAPYRPERVIHLTRAMLEGLYHAHEAGLIHRDFKPENVIIERDDHDVEVPRIVDFGIAILRDAGDSVSANGRLTTNGLVLGTPHYMAPEQAIADPIDHRIDLFAMGIVVYEMLCGKLPFDGTGAEVARANLLLDPPPIAQRVPYLEVDPLLEAFARRLMAKKRTDRPPTAKAARELLDLIERDRTAAAALLGVSISGSERAPAITQDVAPPRAPQPSKEIRAEPDPDARRASALEAPPLVAAPAPAKRAATTDPTKPLPFDEDPQPRPARRLWLVGATAGLAVIAIGTALLLNRGSGDTAAKQHRVAVEQPPPPQPEPKPPEPQPEPVKQLAPEPEPKPPEPDPEPVKQPEDPAGPAKQVKQPPPVKKQPPPPKQVEVQPPEPVKTPPVEAGVTTAEVTQLFAQVQARIGELRKKGATEAADDVQKKQRRVRLDTAILTPATRTEAAAALRAILAESANK
ncbi:MAG: serine/threonine protein kinase [Deltaproteobacteria bacterium]|nr:serine/threonine protein kinase [Deltaproteobacteria bacterium]